MIIHELKWYGQGDVTTINNTFKIKDVRRFEEALCRVTVENWKDCVRHSECLQEEDFIKEDEVIQRFVIHLQDESGCSSNEIENEI